LCVRKQAERSFRELARISGKDPETITPFSGGAGKEKNGGPRPQIWEGLRILCWIRKGLPAEPK